MMNSRYRAVLAVSALILAVTVPAAVALAKATVIHTTVVTDIDEVWDFEGMPEPVAVTGQLRTTLHITINKNRIIVKEEDKPVGVTGVGLMTGTEYVGLGKTSSLLNLSNDGTQQVIHTTNHVKLVGKGKGNDYTYTYVTRTVIHDGEVKVDIVRKSVK